MPNHFINDLAEIVMPNRLVRTLLLAIALVATEAAVFAFSLGVPVTRSHTAAQVTAVSPRSQDHTTAALLPVVIVRPQPIIPTLPTITVRMSRAEAVANDAPRADDYSLGAVAHGSSAATIGALPGAAFDMPYYSFGKSLRHANKE